jgi:predicted HAD superfamily Cof-like phosphohydrolase
VPVEGFRRSDVAIAVAEFHSAFNLPCQTQPSVDVEKSLEILRISLLEEEVGELIAAIHARDLIGIADALADITYVVYGTALTYGINLDAVLSEVHRSNMSKLDHDGKPIVRADGKVLKSELYAPPDVAAVLQGASTRA